MTPLSAELGWWSLVASRILRPVASQSAFSVRLVSAGGARVPPGPNEYRTAAAAAREGVRLAQLLPCSEGCNHRTCRGARAYVECRQ